MTIDCRGWEKSREIREMSYLQMEVRATWAEGPQSEWWEGTDCNLDDLGSWASDISQSINSDVWERKVKIEAYILAWATERLVLTQLWGEDSGSSGFECNVQAFNFGRAKCEMSVRPSSWEVECETRSLSLRAGQAGVPKMGWSGCRRYLKPQYGKKLPKTWEKIEKRKKLCQDIQERWRKRWYVFMVIFFSFLIY